MMPARLAPTPELLAPAGDWEALRAAVANGANAVYFGLPNFNARFRATNFPPEELPQILDFLHDHNVRGYVTLNTLIFTDELPDVARILGELVRAGVDAVIVQDLGVADLIRRVAPHLPVHGSTQMTLTEPRGIDWVSRLGVERVILARELSVGEIQQITAATTTPVEVFVHGALCVAYSGQCLTSEALGGRSANRGQCAQACRLPYEMVVDGAARDFGERAYLLSPQDLAAPELIQPLLAAGVASFKIEGRLKSAHYVAATSQTYRAALDAAVAGQNFVLGPAAAIDLEQSFSRGFTTGFLGGLNHQTLVPARFPKARGVRVGTVLRVDHGGIVVQVEEHKQDLLKPGDGVVFDQGHPEQDEQGGRLYHVEILSGGAPHEPPLVNIRFGPGAINFAAIEREAIVWRTDDPDLRRRMEQTYARDTVVHRQTVNFEVAGTLGSAVTLTARDATTGLTAAATWPGPLAVAQKHPVTLELLREQLGRLGDSPYTLGEIATHLPPTAMLPKSVLNELRREAVTELLIKREEQRPAIFQPEKLSQRLREISRAPRRAPPAAPQISVLVRNEAQLLAVLAWQPPVPSITLEAVYCDFEDVRRYRALVPLAREANCPIGLATLRILKPGEEGLLSIIGKAQPDRILIRNLGGLGYFQEHFPGLPLYGDFSLNVSNPLTAALLWDSGLTRLVPSYDLNWEQLAGLLDAVDPLGLEPVIHQHMPMFHMEHCVFAAMLSTGKDWRDCGRPCDHHRVELRDRVGADLPLVADTGCRNTVYNSLPQTAVEYLPRMLTRGVRYFRVDLLRESATETAGLLDRYARVLAGEEPARQTFRQLRVLNQLGVTRGTLSG
ncbi:MAG: DUF3656 domain-containing protein [Pirellulales bacterium]|nr:DUF3656 domain-containing protein [Pirellulales bacterium]